MSNSSRLRSAALAGLAALGIGTPRLFASETITCDAVLRAAPPQGGAQLGWAVDADGRWLVGGSPFAPPGGAIVMFEGPPISAQQKEPLPPPPGLQSGDRFGFSVSIDDTWMAVGAPFGDGRVRDSGVVYLYHLEGSAWTWSGVLEASDATRDAQFGVSVALRGGLLVVGAPFDADRGSQAGSAYVFELVDGSWTQTAEIQAGDARPFDRFGSAVAVDQGTVIVGAPFADDLAHLNFGAAYVFAQDQGRWIQKNKLAAAERRNNIQFGAAVALRGNRIAIGAPGDDANGPGSGSAYVFEKNGSEWRRFLLAPEDPGPGEQFGTSVDIDDDHLVVGARFDGAGGPEAGAAYLFDLGTRTEKRKLIHPSTGASFGQSVAILRDHLYPGGPLYLNAGAIIVCPTGEPQRPVLECEKTGPASVAAGGTVTYTIVVRNGRATRATGLKLIDPTPAGTERISPVCGKDTDDPCLLDPLEPGQERKIKAKFRVPANATCGAAPAPIVNVAQVSADGGAFDECKAKPTSIQRPDEQLVCEKSGPPSATTGDLITYAVEVRNRGCKAVRNVVLEDPAPAGLALDGVAPPCLALPCNLGTIQPGASINVEARFRVLQGCRDSVENLARVTGSGEAEDTCSVETLLECGHLAVALSAPASLPGGQELELPVQISNQGPGKATNVTLRVDLQGHGSVTEIPADCAADPDTPGRFLCTFQEIVCGDMKKPTFRVQAPVCTGCTEPPGPIRVTAEVTSEACDPDPSNNQASVQVQVDCVCLAIEKTDSPDPVAPGQKLSYEITVANNGNVDAEDVVVKDSLPPAGLDGVVWCQGAACTPSRPAPLVTTVDLPGRSSEIFRLRGIVSPFTCVKTLLNKASAEHLLERVEDVEETRVISEGISLLCTQIDGASVEGSMITYTFVLINFGPTVQADNPGDELTDTLPATLTLVSASADSGTIATAGNTATWNGSLDVCQIVTIKIKATVNFGTAGTIICNQASGSFDRDGNGTNETSVLSDDPERPGAEDPCCFYVVNNPLPDIPTLSVVAALALVLLLAALAVRRLRAAR